MNAVVVAQYLNVLACPSGETLNFSLYNITKNAKRNPFRQLNYLYREFFVLSRSEKLEGVWTQYKNAYIYQVDI